MNSCAEGNTIISLPTEDAQKIEDFIKLEMEDGEIPGLSVAIVMDEQIVFQKGYGYANIQHKTPVTSKTLFEIGSNSKAFTALGIAKLEVEGLLKRTDNITTYLPWLKMYHQGHEANVKIEDLLNHTSGIPFHTIDKIPVSSNFNALEQTVRTLENTALDSKPGQKFQYATMNYDVLGLIIEKVSGQPFEEYIIDKILYPMGLKNTTFYASNQWNGEIAQGYKLGFLKLLEYNAPNYRGNTPAGYYISNIEDMAEWTKLQIGVQGNSEVMGSLIENSHHNPQPIATNSKWAYANGWYISRNNSGEISHDGSNPNFSSYIVFNKNGIGVIVLGNINSMYISSIGQGIFDLLQDKSPAATSDLNKVADTVASILIMIIVIIIVAFGVALVRIGRDIQIKRRQRQKLGIRFIIKIIIISVVVLAISVFIYFIPYFFYNGLSWNFVFIWLPLSMEIALYLVYLVIFIFFIMLILKTLYKKNGSEPYGIN